MAAVVICMMLFYATLLLQVYFDDSKSNWSMTTKLKRDTQNSTALSQDRKFGTYKTAAQLSYNAPGVVQAPEHGHRPVIETNFYRKSNAFLVA